MRKRFELSTLSEVFGADRRSLAVFRILIGADFVYEWINRLTSLTEHYTDAGVLPRALMPAIARRLAIPIFRLSGSATVQAILLIAAAGFAAMLMVGYRTRLATIATWIMHLAVIERLPTIAGGGDNLMRYLLLWSMFVPLGKCWSIDRWLSRRGEGSSTPGNGVGPPIVSLGVAALFVQLASIYFCAGVHKLESPAWRQGLAVCRALQVYTRSTPLGAWLLHFPQFLSLTSIVLPILQIAGAVFLFVPLLLGPMRTLIVFSYASFQVCLGASLVLGNFQQVAVFMMVPFLPSWFWDYLLPKLGIGRPATIPPEARAPEDPAFLGAKWRSTFVRSPLANRISEGLAAALGMYLLIMNLGGCLVRGALPGRPERLAYALNFDQDWDLFSLPEVDKPFGWLVAPAKLADGRIVDLFTSRTEIAWKSPAPFSLKRYVNWRWRMYQGYFLKLPDKDPRKAAYPRYLIQHWNSTHPASEQVESLEILSMSDVLAADGKLRGVRPTLLWKGTLKSALAD